MGELIGFVIGWNSILLRGITVAFVACGWSAYFDNFIGDRVSNFTVEVLLGGQSWESTLISPYPDIIAGIVLLLACIVVALGTKLSANFSAVLTVINIITLSMVVIVSFVYFDFSNMTKNGGFSPFGFSGFLRGTEACYAGMVTGYAPLQNTVVIFSPILLCVI